MDKFLKWLLATGISLVIFLFLFSVISDFDESGLRELEIALKDLPSYDYAKEIRKLKKNGEVCQAQALAETALAVSLSPAQKAQVRLLKAEIDKEVASWWFQVKEGARGFITGRSKTTAGNIAALGSDMIWYGDARDLTMQGMNWATGKEVDELVAILSGLGTLLEFIDGGDWMPATLKVMAKTGAITSDFARYLKKIFKGCIQARKLTPAAKTVFDSLKKFKNINLGKASEILKRVKNATDLKTWSNLAEVNSDVAFFMAKHGADAKLVQELGTSPKAITAMKMALRKGPKGVSKLKLKAVKYSIRAAKSVEKGTVKALITSLMYNEDVYKAVLLVTLLSFLFCFFSLIMMIKSGGRWSFIGLIIAIILYLMC